MRLLKWLILLLLLPILLFAGTGLVIKSMLSGTAKTSLLESVHKATGVSIAFQSADFDLSAWFRLQPAIALTDVTVANPQGFRAPNLLTAGSVQAKVGLLSLFSPQPQVYSLAIDKPKIIIEKNRAGLSNIEALMQGLSTKPSSGDGGVSIQSLSITQGELDSTLTGIDINLTGLAPGKASDVTIKASPFGGKTSRIEFKGTIGPFTATALPVNGDAKIKVAPSELPEGLMDAPKDALAHLDIGLKGDLNDTLAGPATLNFTGFHLGLTGDAQGNFSVSRIMSSPQTTIHIGNAKMQLGKGTWKGTLNLRAANGLIRGTSKGSIQNVDINEFLTKFSTSKDAMQGTLAINNYDVQFTNNDINGTAALDIQKGSIKVLDLLGSIQNAINKVMGTASGETTFSTLTSNLRIAEGALNFTDINLKSPVTSATGEGRINANQTLDFKLDVQSSGNTPIPVEIKGTTASPKVIPNVKKAAVSTGLSLLDKFLKKKLTK